MMIEVDEFEAGLIREALMDLAEKKWSYKQEKIDEAVNPVCERQREIAKRCINRVNITLDTIQALIEKATD